MLAINELKDKKVCIVGGSNGLGLTLTKAFLESAANVTIVDRTPPQISHKNLDIVKSDFNEIDNYDEFFRSLFESSSFEILVNNIRGYRGSSEPLSNQNDIERALSNGLVIASSASSRFIEFFRGPTGSIIHISSIAAQRISGENIGYHLAKAGIESLTRFIAVHSGNKNIRSNAIAPGFIVSDEHLPRYLSHENKNYRIKSEKSHPLQRTGRNSDVANLSLFLASSFASFITGQVITVDGGLGLRDGWYQLDE